MFYRIRDGKECHGELNPKPLGDYLRRRISSSQKDRTELPRARNIRRPPTTSTMRYITCDEAVHALIENSSHRLPYTPIAFKPIQTITVTHPAPPKSYCSSPHHSLNSKAASSITRSKIISTPDIMSLTSSSPSAQSPAISSRLQNIGREPQYLNASDPNAVRYYYLELLNGKSSSTPSSEPPRKGSVSSKASSGSFPSPAPGCR